MISKISFLFSLGLSLMLPLQVFAAPADSIVVVKGQVSDYYIPVTQHHQILGKVVDENGNPLEGATVMFPASPIHDNTDKDGRFELTAAPTDTLLYVYYPGMELKNHPVGENVTDVTVVLNPDEKRTFLPRKKAVATKWYDPENYNPSTYCNPIKISYNF